MWSSSYTQLKKKNKWTARSYTYLQNMSHFWHLPLWLRSVLQWISAVWAFKMQQIMPLNLVLLDGVLWIPVSDICLCLSRGRSSLCTLYSSHDFDLYSWNLRDIHIGRYALHEENYDDWINTYDMIVYLPKKWWRHSLRRWKLERRCLRASKNTCPTLGCADWLFGIVPILDVFIDLHSLTSWTLD